MGFIQHQVTPFFCRRSFSEKFNDTTSFITANWRVLLKMTTIVLLPLAAIQALNVNGLMSSIYGDAVGGGSPENVATGLLLNYSSLMVFGLVATAMLISIVYGLMRMYHATGNDGSPLHPNLNAINFAQFRPYMKGQMGRAWKSIGAMTLIGIAMLVLLVVLAVGIVAVFKSSSDAVLGVVVLLFIYIAMFALLPPLMMVVPAYSFEQVGFFEGMKRGIVYGFKTWRGVFAVVFVFGLIIGMVSGFLSLPWMLLSVMKMVAATGEANVSFASTPWFSFITYLCTLLYLYVCYLGYSAMLVAIAYQYGHAHEVVDGEDFDTEF